MILAQHQQTRRSGERLPRGDAQARSTGLVQNAPHFQQKRLAKDQHHFTAAKPAPEGRQRCAPTLVGGTDGTQQALGIQNQPGHDWPNFRAISSGVGVGK